MFNKLRNRIVIISMATSAAVLILAFSAIYIIAANRMHEPQNFEFRFENANSDQLEQLHDEVSNFVNERVNQDHQQGLNSLLFSLIFTGIALEAAVFLITLALANESIKPVRDAYKAQKDFIANASHEIKTPLAAIQANLEAADIQNNHWIDNIAIKTEELAALNNQLLTLARVESADLPAEVTEINLPQYIHDLITPLQPQIDQKGIKIKLPKQSMTKMAKLNKPALQQILGILIDNAIKYADKKITITADNTAITITNDGATISQDKLDHIFERFYQTDKTKSGVGLGLAIAKQVANQNHWQLTAASDKKSTTFTLKFTK